MDDGSSSTGPPGLSSNEKKPQQVPVSGEPAGIETSVNVEQRSPTQSNADDVEEQPEDKTAAGVMQRQETSPADANFQPQPEFSTRQAQQPPAQTTNPTAPQPESSGYHPYVPFSHQYTADDGSGHMSQPVVYTGPYPDSDPSNDADSAVGSFVSSGSVPLDNAAYQFRQMYGRRYHAYREGAEYHLPNDEKELDRLDLQHHLFLLTLSGSLHRAPLPSDIHEVLDVGTGTGIWAIDFADKYPSATVTGTDLSPIQPAYVPPNCRFYVDDAESQWDFPPSSFDYIHARMLVVAIKNWEKFLTQAFTALRPGGWIELQDLNFPVRCDDGSATPDSPLMHWSDLMMAAAAALGIRLDVGFRFPELLAAAGFVDVAVETHAWPINRWPKEKAMKERGAWVQQNFQEGVQGFSMAFLARGLQWKPAEVEVLAAKVRKQAADRRSHAYMPISLFWARKPAEGE